MTDSELIADNLKKAGWSYGYVSALDCEGRTIWIADAHRGPVYEPRYYDSLRGTLLKE